MYACATAEVTLAYSFSFSLRLTTFFIGVSRSKWGFEGRGSHLATIFGEELDDDGFEFLCSSTKTSGSWI